VTDEHAGRRDVDKVIFETLEKNSEELNELRVDFGKVEANQKSIFTAISTLSNKFETLSVNLSQSTRTPWGIIISAASLFFFIITALSAGFIGLPLKELKLATMNLNEVVVGHVKDGHPAVVKEILGARIRHIEDEQETLNLLIRTIEKYLYEHNGEAKTMTADYKATKLHMSKKVKELEDTHKSQGSFEERLRSLERISFPPTSYRDGRPGG